MGSSPSYLDPVIIPLIMGSHILDVGCGFGRWGCLCVANCWETPGYKEKAKKPEIVGCDGHFPNVVMARQSGFYKEVHHILFPPLPFEDDCFDTVLLIDVIEHLELSQGKALIEAAKRVTADRLILSTPNFPSFREGHSTISGWNKYEAHCSYWPRSLLRSLGFRLYGAGWSPGGRYWSWLLRKLRLTHFYDSVARLSLMSLSRYMPFFSETVVGLWEKKD